MRAVITGASGFLGAHLARTLKDRGVEVRAADRSRGPALDDVDVEFVEIDVLDPASLRAAFEGQDRVFHLAAIISIVGDPTGEVWRVNVHGPRNAATVALECGVGRFVHCSSVHSFDLERCGPSLDESGLPTTHPDAPAYDRSKRAGEEAVRLVVQKGLDAVVVNPTKFDDLAEVRRSIATLIGAGPDTIALATSATDAWETAFWSIPWRRGDVVLTCRSEYVTNSVNLLVARDRFGVRMVIVDDDEHGQIDLTDLGAYPIAVLEVVDVGEASNPGAATVLEAAAVTDRDTGNGFQGLCKVPGFAFIDELARDRLNGEGDFEVGRIRLGRGVVRRARVGTGIGMRRCGDRQRRQNRRGLREAGRS